MDTNIINPVTTLATTPIVALPIAIQPIDSTAVSAANVIEVNPVTSPDAISSTQTVIAPTTNVVSQADAAVIVDISPPAQLLAAASTLQQLADVPGNLSFTDLLAGTQNFVDSFNNLQTTVPDAGLNAALDATTNTALNAASGTSPNATTTGGSTVSDLAQIGVNFSAATISNSNESLTIDPDTLQTAYNANPAVTSDLVAQTAQSVASALTAATATAASDPGTFAAGINATQVDTNTSINLNANTNTQNLSSVSLNTGLDAQSLSSLADAALSAALLETSSAIISTQFTSPAEQAGLSTNQTLNPTLNPSQSQLQLQFNADIESLTIPPNSATANPANLTSASSSSVTTPIATPIANPVVLLQQVPLASTTNTALTEAVNATPLTTQSQLNLLFQNPALLPQNNPALAAAIAAYHVKDSVTGSIIDIDTAKEEDIVNDVEPVTKVDPITDDLHRRT